MNHDPDDEVTVISAEGVGKGVLRGNAIELVVVACPGCGAKVTWTGIYGPWCADCKPRDLPRSRK